MCGCPHPRVRLPARPWHLRPSPYMRPGFSRTFRLARWALLTMPMPESRPKSGWVQPGPRGEAGVCLGSPLNSLTNLAQCFHFSPWPANPARVCVCVCLSLCLPALRVFVSFCLILSVRAPLTCPAPLSSHSGSPTAPLPPSQLCVIASVIPGLRRTETSQAPKCLPFPLFAQLWQHTAPSHLSLQGIQGSSPQSCCLEALSHV